MYATESGAAPVSARTSSRYHDVTGNRGETSPSYISSVNVSELWLDALGSDASVEKTSNLTVIYSYEF